MSDESVLDFINISQSGRWYRWSTKNFPIPRREIETHSANMHMIPENKLVESMLGRVRIGDIVELSGSLVRVDAIVTHSISRQRATIKDCPYKPSCRGNPRSRKISM
jgi:hypothetical protein